MTTTDIQQPSDRPQRFPIAVSLIGGLFFFVSGVWAMVAPKSFFDAAAEFEPYNQHFVQDIGAFQIGLGAVLVLATIPLLADGLAVALVGVAVGSAAHVISHLIGRDLGGKQEADIPLFAGLTVLLLVAGALRLRNSVR